MHEENITMRAMKTKLWITAIVVLAAIMVVLYGGLEYYDDYMKEQAQMEEEVEKEGIASMSEFMKYIEGNTEVIITLIGDSITAGVGSNGYYKAEEGRVVYEDGQNTYYEAVDTCNSWANSLIRYFAEYYENVEVINNGISGASTKYAFNNKEGWIGSDLDVVIVQLGTNDRWDCASVEEFEEYYRKLLQYIDGISNRMIVIAPPPTLNDDSSGYNFGTYEVNQVVLKVAEEGGYTVFSQYDAIMAYSEENAVALEKLLQTDGSHPVDAGYELMYQNLYDFLGLESHK